MKIRTGFVSNSSSSSFVIIGQVLTKEEAIKLVKKGERVVVLGDYFNEGQDMFDLTKEIVKLLPGTIYGFEFIKPSFEAGETGILKQEDINKLKVGDKVFSLTIDQNSTEDIERFKESYT